MEDDTKKDFEVLMWTMTRTSIETISSQKLESNVLYILDHRVVSCVQLVVKISRLVCVTLVPFL